MLLQYHFQEWILKEKQIQLEFLQNAFLKSVYSVAAGRKGKEKIKPYNAAYAEVLQVWAPSSTGAAKKS